MEENRTKLLPGEKFGLSIEEAAMYFEIGPKKIRQIIATHPEGGIFTKNGAKTIILRPQFEKFLMATEEI